MKDGKKRRILSFTSGQNPDKGPGQNHRNNPQENIENQVAVPGFDYQGCNQGNQNRQDNAHSHFCGQRNRLPVQKVFRGGFKHPWQNQNAGNQQD